MTPNLLHDVVDVEFGDRAVQDTSVHRLRLEAQGFTPGTAVRNDFLYSCAVISVWTKPGQRDRILVEEYSDDDGLTRATTYERHRAPEWATNAQDDEEVSNG